jgi:hypothetical protein
MFLGLLDPDPNPLVRAEWRIREGIQAKMTKIAGTGSGSIGQRLFCCSLGFGMRGWTNIRFQIRIDTKISWIYIVLRIQDVFPGSRILMIVHPRIPDSKQQQKRWVDKISSHFF